MQNTAMNESTAANSASDEDNQISCDTHGCRHTTFVCRHLAADPVQPWYCDYPAEDNPWPDAWCGECNLAYEREGEWNELNSDVADIQLLCSGCYDDGLAKSVGYLAGDALIAWEAYVDDCCQSLNSKQSILQDDFQINQYPRWDYDQATAQLVFSGADVPDLIADVEFVGTLSTVSHTWKWSWTNFSLLAPVRSRINAVRAVGEANNYPHLLVPLWHADQADGWHMTSIATDVLGGIAAYRAPSDNGYIFMVILDLRHASQA
ncbi:hypothetical protein GCM10007907_09940 [Chitinimonas prasina]|uniref:Uncharacterized protein n=1 Tax=Chitinimonas prasina TaxID=1434937 RepID=A0ABQ5YBN6_9NEIS|nr:DUF6882 domain-containing protein [Chitinimonas prasina]GLR12204.1 hypothetical protein GCM10007907_09940 [Chitinimonas prasina]